MSAQVAVVITTYYRNETLIDAIESALAQRYDQVEIVVVDDSGERHAEPVVENYDVKYVAHEENRGQMAGWKTGLDATTGEYVQFLDDDDYLDERKLSRQIALLDRQPETGVAYCGVEVEGGRTERPRAHLRGDVLEQALQLDFHPALTSTLLMEREHLADASPLPEFEAGTDIPLRIELAQRTEFDYVYEPLVYRREHYGSQGHSLAAVEARWRVLEDYRDLYESVPPTVRQRAEANAGRFQGRVYLYHRVWSWKAIAGFLRENRASPRFEPKATARLLASLFGAPGVTVSESLLDRWRRLNNET